MASIGLLSFIDAPFCTRREYEAYARLGSAAEREATLSAAIAKAVSDESKEQGKKHVKFGNMCARGGLTEKALHQYELAIAANPLSANARHNAASVCQRLNLFEEAVPHYAAALCLKPTLVESASNMAVAQLNAKRPADAVATCRHAIRLQAEVHRTMNLEASHHLNVALRLLGRRDEAIEATWLHIEQLAGEAAEAEMAAAAAAAVATAAADDDADAWLPAEVRAADKAKPEAATATAAATAAATTAAAAAAAAAAVHPAPISLPGGPPPMAGAAAALTVVCVKWGTLYGAEYANKLSRSCRRALGAVPGALHGACPVARFVCFTEDGTGLDADIEVCGRGLDVLVAVWVVVSVAVGGRVGGCGWLCGWLRVVVWVAVGGVGGRRWLPMAADGRRC